ncbi:hypothetical protein A3K73_02410 [Candidatus Pacearchaeota archaeon RBG_13_36_9]|nr:MAG: hypothetical protein A3K73_02410 [Candidatus Pacearchaeota archaeon RBG_13_36_9]
MSELTVLEDEERVIVLSPYFSSGRGFIFPYGQFGEGIIEECFAFPPTEPESFSQARERLDSLQVKMPTLKDLLEIYSFVTSIPIPLLAGKFLNLFHCYPFFAFNPFVYIPKRREVQGVGGNLEKKIVWEVSDFYGQSSPQETASNQVLLNLIGNQAIRHMNDFFDSTRKHYSWNTKINKVVTCVLRGLEEDYSSEFVKGFPIVQLESSGVGEFAFNGGIDLLKIVLDFWPHEEGKSYGYTFGIIE